MRVVTAFLVLILILNFGKYGIYIDIYFGNLLSITSYCQFLGICPFLGVSKKVETALGMSAVAFVLTIATIVTFLIQKFVLDAFDLGYLQTITFILWWCCTGSDGRIILKSIAFFGTRHWVCCL